MAPQLDNYFQKVDDLAESFIDRLRKAVAIPSISAEDGHRQDVVRVCPTSPTYFPMPSLRIVSQLPQPSSSI